MNVQNEEWLSSRTGKRINKAYNRVLVRIHEHRLYDRVFKFVCVCVCVYLQKNFNEF